MKVIKYKIPLCFIGLLVGFIHSPYFLVNIIMSGFGGKINLGFSYQSQYIIFFFSSVKTNFSAVVLKNTCAVGEIFEKTAAATDTALSVTHRPLGKITDFLPQTVIFHAATTFYYFLCKNVSANKFYNTLLLPLELNK